MGLASCRRRGIAAPCRAFALVALVALGVPCAACRGGGAPAEPKAPAAGAPAVAAPAGAPGQPGRVAPDVPQPAWPAEWTLVARGSAGDEAAPLAWFRLRVPGSDPAAAAKRALDALRPVVGEVVLEDVSSSRAEPRTVGQLKGARFSAVVTAARDADAVEVRVTLTPM